MTQTIRTIQLESKNQLKIAKTLKVIANKLFHNEVAIDFKEGDLLLKHDANVEGCIFFKDQIIITANSQANLLAVGIQALLRCFTNELAKGRTDVVFKQDQRILMIDIGRKYFSRETLFKFIESASLAQFNYLQLHFSENEGFRIESEVAPDIMSSNYLSKDEIREIILYADSFGIEIIPDFDTPGHLKQVLKNRPDWQLRQKTKDGEIKRNPSALNIADADAISFIECIYQEYADLFKSSSYFHIGGDEFVDFDEIDAYPDLADAAITLFGEGATAMDYYVHYINQLAKKISSWGFVPRVWNDGFFRLNRKEKVRLSSLVEITYWTKWHKNMAPIETFAKKGYTIINFNDNYFYYVLGEAASYAYPTYQKIIEEWTPNRYAQSQTVNHLTEQYTGVALSVWCDIPNAQDELSVWESVSPLLLAVSQKQTLSFMSKQQVDNVLIAYFKK